VKEFVQHNAMLERYVLSSCVCLSIRLSQAGTVPKRLNAGSHSATNVGEIPMGSASMKAPYRGGVGSNSDF